jgi:hypothetical protein
MIARWQFKVSTPAKNKSDLDLPLTSKQAKKLLVFAQPQAL